jgi:hypothetical protein
MPELVLQKVAHQKEAGRSEEDLRTCPFIKD